MSIYPPTSGTSFFSNNSFKAKTEINNSVELFGNQKINGVKTFISPPICDAVASSSNELTNKSYIDNELDNVVKKTGDDTIQGTKIFSSAPICTLVPNGPNQLTNKTYVDNFVSKSGNDTISGTKTFSNDIQLNSGSHFINNSSLNSGGSFKNFTPAMWRMTDNHLSSGNVPYYSEFPHEKIIRVYGNTNANVLFSDGGLGCEFIGSPLPSYIKYSINAIQTPSYTVSQEGADQYGTSDNPAIPSNAGYWFCRNRGNYLVEFSAFITNYYWTNSGTGLFCTHVSGSSTSYQQSYWIYERNNPDTRSFDPFLHWSKTLRCEEGDRIYFHTINEGYSLIFMRSGSQYTSTNWTITRTVG